MFEFFVLFLLVELLLMPMMKMFFAAACSYSFSSVCFPLFDSSFSSSSPHLAFPADVAQSRSITTPTRPNLNRKRKTVRLRVGFGWKMAETE